MLGFLSHHFPLLLICDLIYCSEYLNRINLYRQRIWTCKVTAKTNLTFEEALVSEKHATEKVQQFPKELVVPVLRDVQFSKSLLLCFIIVCKLLFSFL